MSEGSLVILDLGTSRWSYPANLVRWHMPIAAVSSRVLIADATLSGISIYLPCDGCSRKHATSVCPLYHRIQRVPESCSFHTFALMSMLGVESSHDISVRRSICHEDRTEQRHMPRRTCGHPDAFSNWEWSAQSASIAQRRLRFTLAYMERARLGLQDGTCILSVSWLLIVNVLRGIEITSRLDSIVTFWPGLRMYC